jgi:hypothetical protein
VVTKVTIAAMDATEMVESIQKNRWSAILLLTSGL